MKNEFSDSVSAELMYSTLILGERGIMFHLISDSSISLVLMASSEQFLKFYNSARILGMAEAKFKISLSRFVQVNRNGSQGGL